MGDPLYGFDLEDIDGLGYEIFNTLAEQDIPIRLAVLALCKAIVLMSTGEEDLDLASYMIDKLNDIQKEESNDQG